MPQFKLKPEALKIIRKRTLRRLIPSAIIILAVVTVTSSINKDASLVWITVPIFIVFFSLMVGFSLYNTNKRLRVLIDTYRISVGDDSITRTQQSTPPLTILFSEIKEIIKYGNGTMCIKGQKPGYTIYILKYLEDYEEFENLIAQKKAITFKSSLPFFQKYPLVFAIFFLGLVVSFFSIDNKIYVSFAGPALIAVLGWLFMRLYQNKNMASSGKRILVYLVIFALMVILVTIIKLTGGDALTWFLSQKTYTAPSSLHQL